MVAGTGSGFLSISLSRQMIARYRRKGRWRVAELRYLRIGNGRIPFRTPVSLIWLSVDPEWDAVRRYAADEVYEPVLMTALVNRLDETDIFYKVGARWGLFTLLAARTDVLGERIHSFEADEDTYTRLVENLKGIDTHTYYGFVGDESAAGAITLDDYAADHNPPTVIKIDVEGAEGPVLRGAQEVIDRHRPTLFVEIHPAKLRPLDDTPSGVFSELDMYDDLQVCLDNRGDEAKWQPIGDCELPKDDVDYLVRTV